MYSHDALEELRASDFIGNGLREVAELKDWYWEMTREYYDPTQNFGYALQLARKLGLTVDFGLNEVTDYNEEGYVVAQASAVDIKDAIVDVAIQIMEMRKNV